MTCIARKLSIRIFLQLSSGFENLQNSFKCISCHFQCLRYTCLNLRNKKRNVHKRTLWAPQKVLAERSMSRSTMPYSVRIIARPENLICGVFQIKEKSMFCFFCKTNELRPNHQHEKNVSCFYRYQHLINKITKNKTLPRSVTIKLYTIINPFAWNRVVP